MRRAEIFGLCALALAPVASAQEQTPFTDAVLLIAAKCFNASESTSTAGAIGLCEQANTELVNKTHDGYTAGNEANVYRTMRAVVLLTLGTKMGVQDGVRSQRSCQKMEEAWSQASQVDVSRSPGRASEMTGIRNSIIAATRVCRNEFGWPPGAPYLPQ